ncbi:MAG: DNA polymerase III subunit delta [Lachnospiraceae bacterium]|nr:DNA polymerase III subunit delta [Lachnospiraceae bacterium]
MKKLENDIKNKIYKRIYVLAGTQSYNRTRYEKALVNVFLAEGDTMNLTKYFGKKIDLKEVFELAETMPFMSERRVIVLEDTGLFTKACEELAEYIPNIPETCVMIFSEEKADARLKQTKAAETTGCVAHFDSLSDRELHDWILRKLGKEHRPITPAALDLFEKRCGDDMWQISNELEKLISYTFGKDGIRPEDVKAVMPAPAEDRIFGMIDAIIDRKFTEALGFYKDLLALKSEPTGILGLLRQQYGLVLHVKEMNAERIGTDKMAEVLKMREARIKMALPAARKSSKISLIDAMKQCADTEERIKTGRVDQRIGVETLIATLCQKDTAQ